MSERAEQQHPPAHAASGCVSCGSPSAAAHDTADGRILMCPPCAALHGIGCP